jgi:hypothetical protein
MYLFKTSGATFSSVISNQKHAYDRAPKNWYPGEIVLVSKNKVDCQPGEKQIQYIMRLDNILPLVSGESEHYWPGSEGRWQYLFECGDTKKLKGPFNLYELICKEAHKKEYRGVVTFTRLHENHEATILRALK